MMLDHVADLGDTTTRTGTDLQDRVAASGALIVARRLPGRDEGWQVIPRIAVDVYAATRDEAWDTAEAAAQRWTARGGFTTPGGVVDRVVADPANAELAYTDPKLRMVSATYRVTARRLL